MHRKHLLALIAIAAALVVPAARAARPTFTPIPAFDFTDSVCGFDIAVHGTAAQTMKLYSDGTIRVTGDLRGTFTANGKTITLNVPGPAMITGDSAVGDGIGAGDVLLPDGRVIFAQIVGRVDIGSTPNVILHGHVKLDLCQALAP